DHAVSFKEPLEHLQFDVVCLTSKQIAPPETGCFITGLSLCSAAWDVNRNHLKEPRSSESYGNIPLMWFQPTHGDTTSDSVTNNGSSSTAVAAKKNYQRYRCPLFVYRPDLAAPKDVIVHQYDGESGLFITNVDLSTDTPGKHWLKRGVTLVCQRD
ncbi:hypothetical protein M427DRAFT_97519, partial [Gonapodya prolifera JEL478]